MKKILIFISMFAIFTVGGVAHAQTNGAVSGSDSSSTSKVDANQGNTQGTQVTITSVGAAIPASQSMHYSGLDRGAPTVVMGGYSSGMSPDNCMNTAQGGVSGPGFGASFGKGVADKNCQLMRRVDAHGRLAQAYGVNTVRGHYQLQQAAIDACVADGYTLDDCVKVNTPY